MHLGVADSQGRSRGSIRSKLLPSSRAGAGGGRWGAGERMNASLPDLSIHDLSIHPLLLTHAVAGAAAAHASIAYVSERGGPEDKLAPSWQKTAVAPAVCRKVTLLQVTGD